MVSFPDHPETATPKETLLINKALTPVIDAVKTLLAAAAVGVVIGVGVGTAASMAVSTYALWALI